MVHPLDTQSIEVAIEYDDPRYWIMIFGAVVFGLFLNNNGCGNNDLGEIKYGLDGLRTNISIYSKNSVIKDWSLIQR